MWAWGKSRKSHMGSGEKPHWQHSPHLEARGWPFVPFIRHPQAGAPPTPGAFKLSQEAPRSTNNGAARAVSSWHSQWQGARYSTWGGVWVGRHQHLLQTQTLMEQVRLGTYGRQGDGERADEKGAASQTERR